MLNSTEHEILNAHEYINIKIFSFISGSDKPRMLLFLLINVKMPTIIGILTFMSRKKSCSAELSMIFLYPRGLYFCITDSQIDSYEYIKKTLNILLSECNERHFIFRKK